MAIVPPRPKGPPLNALRAFEAAARLGGFTKAADELCVTPGAITQHVKTLETWAGAPLFDRQPQGVQLSPLGHKIAAEFSAAFDRLGQAVQALRTEAAPQLVQIAALPSIAQLWLSPRLPAIRKALPEVTLSITAMETPPNMLRDPFDLTIFFSDEPSGGSRFLLGADVIFPVCAPDVAEGLQHVEDLANYPMIGDASWADDWQIWLRAKHPQLSVSVKGPTYSLYSLAVDEAVNGAGVLMGHETLVRSHLKAGRLVAPFSGKVSLDRNLSLALAHRPKPGSTISRLCDMLVEAARK